MTINTRKALTLVLGIASAALLATPVKAGDTPAGSATQASPSEAEKLMPLEPPAGSVKPSGAAQLEPVTPVSSLEDQPPSEATKGKEALSTEPVSTEPASEASSDAEASEAPSSVEGEAPASGSVGGGEEPAPAAEMEGEVPTGAVEDGADASKDGAMEAPAAAGESTPAPDESVPAEGSEASPAGPSSSSVSDEELQKFANAIPSLKSADQNTQKEISQVIQSSGLDEARFDAIYQTQQSPEKQATTKVTTKEKKSFDKAISDIESIEAKGKAEQEKIIEVQGLQPQRFVEILVSLRQDPALRDKMQQLLPKQ
ncbi:MAG: DUF4168 domain-containing protein [Thermosynechococcaceae cyanobacterium]